MIIQIIFIIKNTTMLKKGKIEEEIKDLFQTRKEIFIKDEKKNIKRQDIANIIVIKFIVIFNVYKFFKKK